jgi:hypothetical protein
MATKKKKKLAKSPKSLKKDFRVSEFEWNRIGILANEYAAGNRSRWLVYAALNAPRKYLK